MPNDDGCIALHWDTVTESLFYLLSDLEQKLDQHYLVCNM